MSLDLALQDWIGSPCHAHGDEGDCTIGHLEDSAAVNAVAQTLDSTAADDSCHGQPPLAESDGTAATIAASLSSSSEPASEPEPESANAADPGHLLPCRALNCSSGNSTVAASAPAATLKVSLGQSSTNVNQPDTAIEQPDATASAAVNLTAAEIAADDALFSQLEFADDTWQDPDESDDWLEKAADGQLHAADTADAAFTADAAADNAELVDTNCPTDHGSAVSNWQEDTTHAAHESSANAQQDDSSLVVHADTASLNCQAMAAGSTSAVDSATSTSAAMPQVDGCQASRSINSLQQGEDGPGLQTPTAFRNAVDGSTNGHAVADLMSGTITSADDTHVTRAHFDADEEQEQKEKYGWVWEFFGDRNFVQDPQEVFHDVRDELCKHMDKLDAEQLNSKR